MTERAHAVTMKGNPLTLVGDEIAVGQQAPGFSVLNNSLEEVTLDGYRGRVLLLASVPSLDTPVCDMEIRRFNQEAASLADNVAVVFVSMDLPFAQKRFCAAAGIDGVETLSDHRAADFGAGYGTLVKELRLLSRAIFIVGAAGVVRYVEYVGEIADQPDYQAALNALADVVSASAGA